jgi:excinuclease ABC subunit C
MNNKIDYLKTIAKHLPLKPGVYQFSDQNRKIIYIGKAKYLRKRVLSYFRGEKDGKLRIMIDKIRDIQHIVVDTELDALLLENNLIKKYQPRYNVMLKDDKTYPWICIKNEAFPRVVSTRHLIQDGSEYFGPYPNGKMLRTLLDLFRRLFTLRSCKLNLTPKLIAKGKYDICLEYHIKKCKAPCIGKQSETEYLEEIAAVRKILKGNVHSVIKELETMMHTFAENLAFENAQLVKEKIELLKKYHSHSMIVSPKLGDMDVCSIVSNEKSAFINYLRIIKGAIIQTHTIELRKKLNEPEAELLNFGLIELRHRFHSITREVILPFEIDTALEIKQSIPKIGDKKKLLDLSLRNAKLFMLEQAKRKELTDPERHQKRILHNLQKDLRLKSYPNRIECFDNSNIQGYHPVAAMVCFINARPAKKEYRHYHIKTVEGPNDFASMEEVVFRRYKRLIEEEKELPQLIVIDGGKGQLSAALKSLKKLNLDKKIAILGIAKRLEELYFPGDPIPLYLDKKSESLRLIQQLRDEAHRFGIAQHRKRRSKETIKSELEDIQGIGKKTIHALLSKYKSVKRIQSLSKEELEKTIGKRKAEIITSYFTDS